MGGTDKIKNAAQEAKGQVKETTGQVTGNADLEAKGQAEQVDANARQVAEDLKDTTKDITR